MKKSQWILALLACTVLPGCNESPTRPGPLPTGPSAPGAVYTLSGVISELEGNAVPGVRVQTQGKSVTTDETGRYAISELSGGRLNVELDGDGYEARLITNVSVVRDTTMNFKLEPIIPIAAGETTIVTLHPNDVGYDFPSSG